MIFTGALADVDIFSTADGFRIQDSSGNIIGTASTRAQAQRVADIYAKKGQRINWRTTAGGAGASGGAAGGASSGSSAAGSASSAGRAAGSAGGGAASGAGAGSRAASGAVPATRTTTAVTTGAGAGSRATSGSVPATRNTTAVTTGSGGSNLPATTGGGNVASAASRVNVGGAALGVLGVVSGAAGLYESTAGTEKATWGDVGTGALSGAGVAAGAAALVNAFPIGGQIAYGGAVLIGAVIGSLGASGEMFSETDCEKDPVLGIYACCNISKLSNIDAYRAEIGDRMFADFPYVRYCVQGKQEFKEEQPWLKGRFLDDHWSATTEVGLCPGYSMPVNQDDMRVQLYAVNDENVGFCWAWECADVGRQRSGGTCVGSDVADVSEMGPAVPANLEEILNQENDNSNVIGTNCAADDLPQYATAGTYINNGVSVVCAATACKSGTYLVVNLSGVSQGWCVASTYCTDANTHLNIIDGTKTDLQCVADAVPEMTVSGGELDADVAVVCSNATLDRLNATAAVYNQTIDDCVPTGCKDGYRLDGVGENAKCVVAVADDDTENTEAEAQSGTQQDAQSDDDDQDNAQGTTTNNIDTRDECERGVEGYAVFEGVCMPMSQIQQIQSQREEEEKQLAQQQAEEEIEKLTENADAMREREQSLANRLIGGAAIGAAGIGGMQVASALAEQNADADAERDMAAYLATFRCDFGQGATITGGESNIQLPGANVLLPLYQEYISLASDLKTRKESLGMVPGIESEIISDAAESGLYDNAATGIVDGAYTSLSRALSDTAGTDADEWAAQQSDTASQLKTGAIVGGAGVLGGAVGNVITTLVGDKTHETADEKSQNNNTRVVR